MKNLAIISSQGSASIGRLIAAGPLTKQPGTKPFRTVILQYEDDSFSVHDECFRNEAIIDQLQAGNFSADVNSYLHRGNYFKKHQIVEATNCFAERLTRLSMYLESIYREEVTA